MVFDWLGKTDRGKTPRPAHHLTGRYRYPAGFAILTGFAFLVKPGLFPLIVKPGVFPFPSPFRAGIVIL